MDEKTAVSYYNDLLVRLEEIMFHELSGMVHPKVEYVGTDFLKGKNITGSTPSQVVDSCIKEMKAAGLVGDATYSIGGDGLLLTLTVKDCVHLPMEAKLKAGFKNEGGVEPFLCPIMNMVLDRILNILHYEMIYTAQMNIDVDRKTCVIKGAMYENPEKIGMVGDWKSAK